MPHDARIWIQPRAMVAKKKSIVVSNSWIIDLWSDVGCWCSQHWITVINLSNTERIVGDDLWDRSPWKRFAKFSSRSFYCSEMFRNWLSCFKLWWMIIGFGFISAASTMDAFKPLINIFIIGTISETLMKLIYLTKALRFFIEVSMM